jgi:MFS family permease
MAMFVLVVDTSLMNVSISAVVRDLDTTVSGVQSAIALEALVSAAFILIGSKVADLIGRKRAYVLGLLGYAIGALAMTLAQGLTAIIVFWAIIGGDAPYTGPRSVDWGGSVLSVLAWAGSCWASSCGRKAARPSGR